MSGRGRGSGRQVRAVGGAGGSGSGQQVPGGGSGRRRSVRAGRRAGCWPRAAGPELFLQPGPSGPFMRGSDLGAGQAERPLSRGSRVQPCQGPVHPHACEIGAQRGAVSTALSGARAGGRPPGAGSPPAWPALICQRATACVRARKVRVCPCPPLPRRSPWQRVPDPPGNTTREPRGSGGRLSLGPRTPGDSCPRTRGSRAETTRCAGGGGCWTGRWGPEGLLFRTRAPACHPQPGSPVNTVLDAPHGDRLVSQRGQALPGHLLRCGSRAAPLTPPQPAPAQTVHARVCVCVCKCVCVYTQQPLGAARPQRGVDAATSKPDGAGVSRESAQPLASHGHAWPLDLPHRGLGPGVA